MPMKGSGAAELNLIDRWDGGVGWLAYPEETMQRASHAVSVDGDVWVLDPVDADGVDELLGEFGDVAGVVCCLDRHKRDSGAIANRHEVPVFLPEWMTGVADAFDAPTRRFGRSLADTGFQAIRIRNSTVPPWQEVGLYAPPGDDPEEAPVAGTLYVPEAVGTCSYFRTEQERMGVHPMLRLFPPRAVLEGLRPERILVGHGEGVMEDAHRELRAALDRSRSETPSLYLKTLKSAVFG